METDLPIDAKIFILGGSAWAKGIKNKNTFLFKEHSSNGVYISNTYIIYICIKL